MISVVLLSMVSLTNTWPPWDQTIPQELHSAGGCTIAEQWQPTLRKHDSWCCLSLPTSITLKSSVQRWIYSWRGIWYWEISQLATFDDTRGYQHWFIFHYITIIPPWSPHYTPIISPSSSNVKILWEIYPRALGLTNIDVEKPMVLPDVARIR